MTIKKKSLILVGVFVLILLLNVGSTIRGTTNQQKVMMNEQVSN